MKTSRPKIKLRDLDISYFKGKSIKEKGQEGDAILVPSGSVFPSGIKYDRTKRFFSSNYNIKEKILQDGDFLFNCGGVGTLGRSSIFRHQSSMNTVIPDSFILVIRSKNTNVLNDYIFYFFQTEFIKNKIIANTRGTTGITSIRTESILEFLLPATSILEQRRIVDILDEIFKGIAQAKENTEKNLLNVRELFESYLKKVFENKSEGWKFEEIGNVCDLVDSLHKTPKYSDEGYPMVRVTEIKYGPLETSGALKVNEDTYKEFSKRYKPKIGDIVFSRVGASFGVSSFINKRELFCLGQNTVFIIPKINSFFCYYFLNSPSARSQMNKLVAGSAQPTISLKSIKELIIPLPSPTQQQTIVQNIDNILAKVKKIEAIYQQKLNTLEELKNSILQKAFNGELQTAKAMTA